MNKALLRINWDCNNNCEFCHSRAEGKKRNPSLRSIQKKILKLQKKNQKNIQMILLTGGEPSINENFLKIIRFTKKCGFEFGIITNGRIFSNKKIFNDFLKENPKYLYISLHGARSKTYNEITNTKSFSESITAIKNFAKIKTPKFELYVNFVITDKNLFEIEKMVDLAKKYKIKNIKFSLAKPKYKLKNPVSLEKAAKKVKDAIEKGKDRKINVFFEGFPLCIMKKHLKNRNEFYTNKIVAGTGFESEDFESHGNEWYSKPKICVKCKLNKVCLGVYKEYLKFKPTPIR